MTSNLLDNDGFWPDIDLRTVAMALRLGNCVPARNLEPVVLDAMHTLNHALRPLKRRYRAEGYDTLAEVPGAGDEGLPLYRRAVYGAVGALLGIAPVAAHNDHYRQALQALLDGLPA